MARRLGDGPGAFAREHGPGLALYAALFAATGLLGVPMHVPFEWAQVLDRPLLEDRLAESILHLHGQPPLLNLALGLVLKLARALHVAPEPLLLALQLAVGAAAVVALGSLARALLGDGPARRVALGVILLQPFLYLSLRVFSYTAHELALLALSALAGRRFLESGRTGALAAACGLLAALSNERSLFHFAFTFGLAALLVLLRRGVAPDERGSIRPRAALLAVTAALLLVWPLKNLAEVGVFSPSSWQGFNLADALEVPHPRLASLFLLVEPEGKDALEREAAALVPARLRDVPAVARLRKAGGTANWNHYAMAVVSRELQSRTLARLGERPGLLFGKARDGYLGSYAAYAGREPLEETAERGPPALHLWLTAYQGLLFTPLHGPAASLFAYSFPLALLLAGLRLRREWRSDPLGTRTAALLLAPVVWVLLMVLLVEGSEGNRIRYSTEPSVVLLAAWGLAGLSRRRPGATA